MSSDFGVYSYVWFQFLKIQLFYSQSQKQTIHMFYLITVPVHMASGSDNSDMGKRNSKVLPLSEKKKVTLVIVTRKVFFYPRTGFYFRTCEDGAGWHLIPYRISLRSEFFSQAYKTWHIT